MITISTFAAMALLFTLFAKFIPVISIWELKVGEHPLPALTPQADGRSAAVEGQSMKPRRGARTVYALFRDPDAVQRAVDGLRADGVSENEIVVMSSEPYEEL